MQISGNCDRNVTLIIRDDKIFFKNLPHAQNPRVPDPYFRHPWALWGAHVLSLTRKNMTACGRKCYSVIAYDSLFPQSGMHTLAPMEMNH